MHIHRTAETPELDCRMSVSGDTFSGSSPTLLVWLCSSTGVLGGSGSGIRN